VQKLHAGLHRHLLHQEVRRGAGARRAIGELARIGARVFDEIAELLNGESARRLRRTLYPAITRAPIRASSPMARRHRHLAAPPDGGGGDEDRRAVSARAVQGFRRGVAGLARRAHHGAVRFHRLGTPGRRGPGAPARHVRREAHQVGRADGQELGYDIVSTRHTASSGEGHGSSGVRTLHDASRRRSTIPSTSRPLAQLDQVYWYKSSEDYARWAPRRWPRNVRP